MNNSYSVGRSEKRFYLGKLFFIIMSLMYSYLASAHQLTEDEDRGDGWDEFFHEAWDQLNNPDRLKEHLEKKWPQLPLSGKLNPSIWQNLWIDSYWQSNKGGIAYRWLPTRYLSSSQRSPFRYQTYTKSEVMRMTLDQRSRLSPAEKFDLYMGNYQYPTVEEERKRNNENHPEWFGLCHGMAAAAIHFPSEPSPITVESADGLKIPFGSSDLKALLSFYTGYYSKAKSRYLGNRCDEVRNRASLDSQIECRDSNAGTFHLILTNYLGLHQRPFTADLTRDQEVWNYVITDFISRPISRKRGGSAGAAPGTVEEIVVETKIRFTQEGKASWYKMPTKTATKYYQYRLELNADQEIIGGTWLTYDRPDFLWFQQKPIFKDYYQGIEKLYQLSI